MARITIEISQGTRKVLEEMSARTGRSVSELIEESIVALKKEGEALDLVRRARQRASLSESEAETIARKETSS